ncbi:hypothetical protein DdX_07110 [Ditylenchus destructor]|uniref:F-box domain-containing protein n=1 Tax=Ditylenchus destructor TaxID=166010 RepID=A0AAD4N497_9BILA|nr:hypothetical protein DdX_07110 [Ditylenchus destructor]
MLLTNYLLQDIFKFLERRELISISFASKRFNGIVERGIPNAPYVVLNHRLFYNGKGKWEWKALKDCTGSYRKPPQKLIKQLLKLKFARLDSVIFRPKSESPLTNKTLSSVSHLWEDRILAVKLTHIDGNLAKFLASAREICVECPLNQDMNAALRILLSGKCDIITIGGGISDATFQMPIAEIVSFLFRPVGAVSQKLWKVWLTDNVLVPFRMLVIGATIAPQRKMREELFSALEKVFIKETGLKHFFLAWSWTYDPQETFNSEPTRIVRNPNTNQELHLYSTLGDNGSFKLIVK